jgi:4-hydroxybenzoate polyprenyltransferase
MFVFFVLYILLSILCVLFYCIFNVFFLPMYIVIYFLFVYNCTDHSHRVETQMQLINVISCHVKHEK